LELGWAAFGWGALDLVGHGWAALLYAV